jgi:hypothetical protein
MEPFIRKFLTHIVLIPLVMSAFALAQPQDANYDEAKVPDYTLPDPLVGSDGTPIIEAKRWWKKRRPEILKLFEEQVYGRSPGKPKGMSFETISVEDNVLDGRAVRKQVRVFFSRDKNGHPDLPAQKSEKARASFCRTQFPRKPYDSQRSWNSPVRIVDTE